MTARDLLALLETKHAEDLFIAQCKDGPTQQASHRRLDAWALRRSWAHPCSFGYEIKVSRSDWIRDDKIDAYLPLCHRLHVVCPAGLIGADELPPGVGLLWASSTGARLYTKRKAAHRDIEWPIDLLLYVLYARVKTVAEASISRDSCAYWRDWLERKTEKRELGYRVGRELRELVSTLRIERDDAVKRYERVKESEAELEALGLTYLLGWSRPEDLVAKVMAHVSADAGELTRSIGLLAQDLQRMKARLDALIAEQLRGAPAAGPGAVR